MNTLACMTVAVPALNRAQYASLVRQSGARRYRPLVALAAVAFALAAFAGIARADDSLPSPVSPDAVQVVFTPGVHHAPRTVSQKPGNVAFCAVTAHGDLVCGAAVPLASAPAKVAR